MTSPYRRNRPPRLNRIQGQFAARTIAMLESPAYRVLTQSAHRVMARLEIELAHHGGNDNGKLPVTFDDFVSYGIDRHSIAPALREVVALGFVEITEPGRAGNADWRAPNRFRLTYKTTRREPSTDEWKKIETLGQAQALARAARRTSSLGGKTERQCGEVPSTGGPPPHQQDELKDDNSPSQP